MNKHYLWIKCACPDYYKFLNKIATLNLDILDIRYNSKTIYLKVSIETYEKIQKYLKSYKFSKVKDLGLINLKNIILKYKEFVLAFILGIGLLLLINNLIIKVNISHENAEIREILKDELADAGIKTLSFKKSYDELQKIKKNILDKYPDRIDWLEFEIDGLILNVRVEERIITNTEENEEICDIVATKEGTISSLKVFQGEALVNPNDLVKKDDVLIKGIITYNNEEKARVCASGEVYAHTWYTVNVSIPLQHEENILTGKKKYNLVWQNDSAKTRLLRERFPSFTSSYKTLLAFLDYKLLLETEAESQKQSQNYTEEEALNMGLLKAEESLKRKLQDKDEIIDKKVLKKSLNDSKMELEIFVIVNELISTPKRIEAMDIEGTDGSDQEFNQNNNQ